MKKIISTLLVVLLLFLLSVPVFGVTFDDGDIPEIIDINDYYDSVIINEDGSTTQIFNVNNGFFHYTESTSIDGESISSSYYTGDAISTQPRNNCVNLNYFPIKNKYVNDYDSFNVGNDWLYIGDVVKTDMSQLEVTYSFELTLSDPSVELFMSRGSIYFFDADFNLISKSSPETRVKLKTQSSGYYNISRVPLKINIPHGACYLYTYCSFFMRGFNGNSTLTINPGIEYRITDFDWEYDINPNFGAGQVFDYYVDESAFGFGINGTSTLGDINYQWYTGDNNGPLRPVSGATNSAFYPPTNLVGEFIYWGTVTFSFNGMSETITVGPVTVNVSLKPPDKPIVIAPDITKYDYILGSGSLPDLNSNASVSDGGTLTYQWYKGSNPTTGTVIPHATSPTYKPAPNQEGTWYYWCEVTNTNSAGSETVKTTPIKIVVKRPTIDDITVNWGNKPIQITKGYPYTLKVSIPNGLFDSYSLQWYIYHDATYKEVISGATEESLNIPTDTLGVKRYYCVIRGTQGDTTITTMKLTPDIIIVDEDTSDITSDSNTGITWNWGNSPIRLKINQYKLLQVFVPDNLDVTVVQWYRQSVFGQPEPISGANDYYYSVPTNKVGTWKYTCAMVFKDGSGFSCTADIVVLEDGSFDSGGSDPGGAGTGSNAINNDMFFNPAIKNNLDLVQWALNAYNNGWGYVTGTYGQILTQDLLDMKAQQYPDNISQYYNFIQTHWLNRRTADCIGLIKGYCWYDPTDGEIKYNTNGCPDKDPDSMFAWCTEERGPMSTMPELPGIMLYKGGHVGIYIGNGWVIEARGTQFGVIKTHIDDLAWTNWAKLPCITYLDNSGTDDDNDEEILGGLAGIWQSLKNLPQALLDGIKGLFVPDAEDIAEYSDQWQNLLANRFGAIYQSVDVIDQFASGIQEADQTNTVYFPIVSLSLAGAQFSFGGWDVQIVPTGFDFIITTLKRIISIVATLAFINAMRIKFEKILGGGAA